MKKKMFKRVLKMTISTLTMIGMLVTGLPQTATSAYADGLNVKSVITDTSVLATDVNAAGAQIVSFGNAYWHVIGYGSTGNMANADANGAITLLCSDIESLDDAVFGSDAQYGNSTQLRERFDEDYDAFSAVEKTMVKPRTLLGGSGSYDDNKIAGETVTDEKLWPLSVAEAQDLPDGIRKLSETFSWWLRTPGTSLDGSCVARVVGGNVDTSGTYSSLSDSNERPAMYINTDLILLISCINNGKNPGASLGTFNAIGYTNVTAGKEWRFTIKDSSRNFAATRIGNGNVQAGDKIKIGFLGAGTAANEYVSALIVSATNENDVLYYGHIAKSTAQSQTGTDVTIPSDLASGNYILKVFSEQVNTRTQKYSDLASEFVSIPITVGDDNNGGNNGGSGNNEESQGDYLDELRVKLAIAIELGGEQLVTWNKGTALPYDIMKTLEDNPQITLEFSYVYGNSDYMVRICGKDVKTYTDIPWYGPLYLLKFYGVANAVEAPKAYIVKKGDTLSGIAVSLHTTVNNLASLNGIVNRDFILEGQTIKY